MAGLLDNYGTDPIAQGLLGLSGALLTPRAQGGGLGAGFQAFNAGAMQAGQLQRQMQQDALRQQLLGAQLKNFEAEALVRTESAAEKKAARERAERIARRLAEGGGGAQTMAAPAQADMPMSMGAGGGFLGPQGDAPDSLRMPTFSPMQAAPQGAAQRPGRLDMYNEYQRQAKVFEQEGDFPQALKLREMAQKAIPELKEQARVLVNGRPTLRMVFKDGTYEDVTDAAPTANMESINFGGYRQNQNKDTGQFEGPQTPITMDEAQRAANARALEQLGISRGQLGVAQGNLGLSRERLNFERNSGGQPQWDQSLSMWVTRPTEDNPTGRAMAPIGPDGRPVARPDKAPTESQSKDFLFASRADAADRIASSVEGKANIAGAKLTDTVTGIPVLGAIPGGVANWMQTKETQQYMQAKRDFVNAVLRKESGAVIGKDEFDSADKQYFPQPGDGPDVVRQKAEARRRAVEGIKLGAGPLGKQFDASPPQTPRSLGPSDPRTVSGTIGQPSVDDLVRKYTR
jgi:hypothetical protein